MIALLPTPSVLDIMSGDLGRTQELGNAVLADRAAVMDAIQDQRQKAYSYGYLRTTPQYRVVTPGPGDIEIIPVNPSVIFVPYYDPNIVYFRPRPGFYIGGAIGFVNAFFAVVTGFALIWHIWWMAGLGAFGAFTAFLLFAFRGEDEIEIPAERIAQFEQRHQAEVAP